MSLKSQFSALALATAASGLVPSIAAAVGGAAAPAAAVPTASRVAAMLAVGLQQTAAPAPPFVYRPGPNGVGFYQTAPTRPAAAPAATRAPAATQTTVRPQAAAPRTRNRDWSTGRSMTLAKPWMRSR